MANRGATDRKETINEKNPPQVNGITESGRKTKGMEKLELPQGIKWTKQRKSVYTVLQEAAEPLSAVQIYRLAERPADGEEYAVSTIYRILAFFEEKGLVSKTTWMGDGTVVYELNRGHHTHYAVCLECHRRIALSNCPFSHISLEQETGDFTVTGHKLEVYGYCKDCKKG